MIQNDNQGGHDGTLLTVVVMIAIDAERGTSYNGQLYGSDEAIKARAEEDWRNGHGDCDHEVRSIISDIWPDEDD